MPIKRPSAAAISSIGITLIGLGVFWESLKGPSLGGWLGIGLGLLLTFLKQKPRFSPLRWPILILLVMSGISLLVTTSAVTTIAQITRLWAGVAGFIGLVNWARHRRQLVTASLFLLGAGTLVAIAAPTIVRWNQTKGVPIPDIIYAPFPLLVADAVHPNVMVSLMIVLLPLPLAYLLLAPRVCSWPLSSRSSHILLFFSLLLMSGVLLLTKSRGGYAAGAVGVLVVLCYAKNRLLTTILVTAGIITVSLLLLNDIMQTAPTIDEITDTGTLSFREEVWSVAATMIGDFPFTGIGMGTFNDVASRLYPLPQVTDPGAHNLSLQLGVDLGLPGLVAYLSIIGLALFMAKTTISRVSDPPDPALKALSVGLFAGLIALVLHGLVDITTWGTRAAVVPWLIIGLITAVHMSTRKNNVFE